MAKTDTVTDMDYIIKTEDLHKSFPLGNHEILDVLKGVNIADNSVIGCMSVCTKKEYLSNSIYAGSPARLIKTDIHWDSRQL